MLTSAEQPSLFGKLTEDFAKSSFKDMAYVVAMELEESNQDFGTEDLDTLYLVFFNNFCLYLPADGYEMGGLHRQEEFRYGFWNRPVKGFYEERRLPYPKGMSQLRLNQTGEQFYRIFDAALEAENTPVAEIKILQVKTMNPKEDRENRAKMYKLALPAYIRLRAVGYSHTDLTA